MSPLTPEEVEHIKEEQSIRTAETIKTGFRLWLRAVLIILGIFFGCIITVIMVVFLGSQVINIIYPNRIPAPTPTRPAIAGVNKGQELYQSGQLQGAIAAYQQAVYTDPKNLDNYIQLARIQIFAQQYDGAGKSIADALLIDPRSASAHALNGWLLGSKGDAPSAYVELDRAIALDPRDALAHAYEAEILAGQNDPALVKKALDESQKAMELSPDGMESHRARGIVLMANQDYQGAVNEFEKAIIIEPNLYDLYRNIGTAYLNLNQDNSAQDAFLKSYQLFPQDKTTLVELSHLFLGAAQNEQAVKYAKEAVTAEPSNPDLHANLGVILYNTGDFAGAAAELELAIKGGLAANGSTISPHPLDKSSVEYYLDYGVSLARISHCKDAMPVFQILIQNFQDDQTLVSKATDGMKACQP